MKFLILLAYVACIAAANLATTYWGLVPAGFGLLVTTGTYAAGLALGLRDALQDIAGIRWVFVGIAIGVIVSAIGGDTRIALASAAAFLLAETADLAVYTPLRKRGFRRAVIASNAVGAVIDTAVFLAIAGFPFTTGLVVGQLLVKAVWVTGSFLLVAEVVRRAVPRKPQFADGA